MAKQNILDVILNTINEVQKKNHSSVREETADPNVFDLLRDKIQSAEQKHRRKRVSKGKSPDSFLDIIRKQIEGTRRANKKDPDVQTAPGSVFDNIHKKLDQKESRVIKSSIQRIADEYRLDVDRLPVEIVEDIQARYKTDLKSLDKQYAGVMYEMLKQVK